MDTRLILHLEHRAVVARPGLKIGSGAGNDIVLDEAAGVARLHAVIRATDACLHAVAVEPQTLTRDDQSPCERLELRPGLRFFIGSCLVECSAAAATDPGTHPETPVTLPAVGPDDGLQPLYDRPVLRLGLLGLRGAGKTGLLATLAMPPKPGGNAGQGFVLRHECLPNADQPRDLAPRRVRQLKEEFAAGNQAIGKAAEALAQGDAPDPSGKGGPGLQRFVFQLGSPQEGDVLVELIDYDGGLLEQLNDPSSTALQQALRGSEGFLVLPPPRPEQHWQPLLHALALLKNHAEPPPVAVLVTGALHLTETPAPQIDAHGPGDFIGALRSMFPEVIAWPPGPGPLGDHDLTACPPHLQALRWLVGRINRKRRDQLEQRLETLRSRVRKLAPLNARDHVGNGLIHSFSSLLTGRANRFNDPDDTALGPALERLRGDCAHDRPMIAQIDQLVAALEAKTKEACHLHRKLTRTVRVVTVAAIGLLLLATVDVLTNHQKITGARQAVAPVRLEIPAEAFHQSLETLHRYESSPWFRHLILRFTSLSKAEAADLQRNAFTRRRELLLRQSPSPGDLQDLIDELEQHYAGADGAGDEELQQARQALGAGRLVLTLFEALASGQTEAFEATAVELVELPENAVFQALTWHHGRLASAAERLASQAAEPARFAGILKHLQQCRKALGETRALAPVRRALDDLEQTCNERLLVSMAGVITGGDPVLFREHLRALGAVEPASLEAALDARAADIDAALVALLNERLRATPPDFDGAGARLAELHQNARSLQAPVVLLDKIKKGFPAIDRAEADHRAYERVRATPTTAVALGYLGNQDIEGFMRPALEDWMNEQLVEVQTAISLAADEEILAAYNHAEVVVQARGREVARFKLSRNEWSDPESRGESSLFFVNPRDSVRIEAEVTMAKSRTWWFGEITESYRGERDYLWRNTPNERFTVALHPDEGESSLRLEMEVVERKRPEVPPRWNGRLTSLVQD